MGTELRALAKQCVLSNRAISPALIRPFFERRYDYVTQMGLKFKIPLLWPPTVASFIWDGMGEFIPPQYSFLMFIYFCFMCVCMHVCMHEYQAHL